MASKKYLFVCGCPRSGTSALAKLLSASDDVVLGQERYGHRSHPAHFSLRPDLFEKERFLNVEQGDTFYDSLDHFARYYAGIEQKIDACRYIGEKRPDLYLSYHRLFHLFPDPAVFFIFRDIYEVASSYNVRARSGSWPAKKDYKAAVHEWNQSLAFTLKARENGLPVHCVAFEDVLKPASNHQRLFDVLGLAYDAETERGVQRILKEAEGLTGKRTPSLTPAERRFVERKANLASLEEIRKVKMRLD